MQTADVRYRFLGDSSDLVAAGKEAQTALDATAREATVAGKKIGDSFDHMGDKAGKVGGAAKKLRGALGAISPELASMAGAVDDAADAVEVFSAAGLSAGAILGPVAVAVAALGAVYLVLSANLADAEEKQKAAADSATAAQEAYGGWSKMVRELADELAIVNGLESEAQQAARKRGEAFDTEAGKARAAMQARVDAARAVADANKDATSQESLAFAKKELSAFDAKAERLRETIDLLAEKKDLEAAAAEAEKEAAAAAAKANAAASKAAAAAAAQAREDAELDKQFRAELDESWARQQKAEEDWAKTLAIVQKEQAEAAKEESDRAMKAAEELQDLQRAGSEAVMDGIAEVGEALKDAGRAGFAIWKASALAQIVFDTAIGVQKAIAEFAALPPVAAALSATIIASGAIQAGKIAAEQPTFHMGGVNRVDEVNATIQKNETVLTARGTAEIVSAINRGQMGGGGGGPQIQVYEHRAFGRFIRDEVNAPTVLGTAITSARSVMPGRRPRRI